MNNQVLNNREGPSKVLQLTRICHVNREVVFNAWTDPKILKSWWGPDIFNSTVLEHKLAVGGKIRIVEEGKDGSVYFTEVTYKEIAIPTKLVLETSTRNKDNIELFRLFNTVVFTPVNGETELKITIDTIWCRPGAEHYIDGLDDWWTQAMGKLRRIFDGMM